MNYGLALGRFRSWGSLQEGRGENQPLLIPASPLPMSPRQVDPEIKP
jgi:hypothetical protein